MDWSRKFCQICDVEFHLQSMHVWAGPRDLWRQTLGGCNRAATALLKASSGKRLGSRQVPRRVQKQLEAEKAETTKRPKTHSKRGSKELCAGFSPGFPCLFSKTNIGGPARTDDERKCMFCDPEKMSKACETAKGRGSVVRSLKAFKARYMSKAAMCITWP